MKARKAVSLCLLAVWSFTSCSSGSGGSSGGSSDFSDLSYAEAASLTVDKGIDGTAAAAKVATTYHDLLALNEDTASDPDALQAALDGFADALADYNTLINDLITLNNITFPEGGATLLADNVKSQYTDPSGVDTLNAATDALLAKKAECDELFAKVPKLPSTPADFDKLAKAQQCVKEFKLLGIEQAVDAGVSDLGGFTGGAATGAAVVYFGGTLTSGGGLLLVTAGAFISSRVVGALWNACKPDGSKLDLAAATTGGSCAFSHAKGETGESLLLQAVGTGTLQIFIEGCAPISFSNITISNGQAITVDADCEPLDDDIDPSDVSDSSLDSDADVGEPAPTDCANVVGITTTISPSDPGPSDSVTVTTTTLPPAASCPVSYNMFGTDGYTQAGSLTTGFDGEASFVIPAAGKEGVIDTVTTTDDTTGAARTINYTF